MNIPSPELLSPAGTLKHMRYAFAYGADAVYAGQPRYSLRVRNNEFNHIENVAKGIEEAHSMGKTFYLACNITPHNDKIKTFIDQMEPIVAMKPDALIMADPGLIMMIRDKWPEQEIHLSVQANAVNHATVKFWGRNGISRVILSRELSIDEIEQIRHHCPETELEVFVHGALCIAYSGRCLLSGYMSHRDPNQGTCTNSCRWKYDVQEASQTEEGNIVGKPKPPLEAIKVNKVSKNGHDSALDDKVFLLEEKNRPGEYMPAFEDEHGTYIMNSKDLRAIQHVKRLTEMGVHSLKIEGRTKSYFYAARTAQIYRRAIDDAVAGKEFDMSMMDQLESLANRGYTEGFYRRHKPEEYQNYEVGNSVMNKQQFVGDVVDYDRQQQILTVEVKNKFCKGDELELMLPDGNRTFNLKHMMDKNSKDMDVAPGSGHVVKIEIPESIKDFEYGMLMRTLPKSIAT